MPPPLIFDRQLLRSNRARAAPTFHHHNFLLEIVTDNICDRLLDITTPFPTVLDLGCYGQNLHLRIPGCDNLICTDLSQSMLTKSSATHKLLMDEELLAFAPNSFDLVISNLNLHLVNDLPGTLSQIRSILKPGGLLLGSILGGDSLTELKQAMLQCDLAKFSATCPHIIPMIDIKTMGQLLQRTGFSMPVTDNESLVICYDHVLKLMYDLRLMGQGNILRDRAKRYLGRDYFNLLQQYYRQLYPLEDGISCSFEVVYFMGIVSY